MLSFHFEWRCPREVPMPPQIPSTLEKNPKKREIKKKHDDLWSKFIHCLVVLVPLHSTWATMDTQNQPQSWRKLAVWDRQQNHNCFVPYGSEWLKWCSLWVRVFSFKPVWYMELNDYQNNRCAIPLLLIVLLKLFDALTLECVFLRHTLKREVFAWIISLLNHPEGGFQGQSHTRMPQNHQENGIFQESRCRPLEPGGSGFEHS